ncbi:MAG: hypothetical protein P4L43_07965 [Syntrophobacteraceae bacterium]|nr:hypothetical protein [Syntrophobacteraceae bacterium]
MKYGAGATDYLSRILLGFTAGFFATLIFHQLTVLALWVAGVSPFAPFPLAATKPFGVPAVISLAVWGGIWGILFAFIHDWFPARAGYWVAVFLFGAICPSLVAFLVVMPLKGLAVGGGWHPPLLLTAFLANGMWGVGLGLILMFLSGLFGARRDRLA